MPMQPDVYTERRDTLVTLLKAVIREVTTIESEHTSVELDTFIANRAKLDSVVKRVREDQFKIVLVARFQGGKSTSFNAIADGRVISPIGNSAIKCSAAVIRAHHVVDPAEVGAYVTLRNDKKLGEMCRESLGREVHLSDPEDHAKAIKEHQEKIKNWLKNRGDLNEEERERLLISGLVLHFYGSPAHAKLRLREHEAGVIRMSLDEVTPLVRFPKDYGPRYSDGDPSQFRAEEILFPFIADVLCKLQSENLQSIGAAVTDCPGLFASTYDTDTALTAMIAADAVWYLLEDKGLGESEDKAIRICKKICGDRLFFTVNLRGKKRNAIDVIFPSIISSIKNIGVEMNSQELRPYHALLALLTMQGHALLDGSADKSVGPFLQMMARNMQFDSQAPIKDIWGLVAGECLNNLRTPGEEEFNKLPTKLSREGIEIVRRESDLNDILPAIEKYVIDKKWRAILIDNGSQKATDFLRQVESDLISRERSGEENVEKRRAELDATRKAMTEFTDFANQQFSVLEGEEGEGIDKHLAEDFYNAAILTKVKEIAEDASYSISQNTSVWELIKKTFVHGGSVKDVIERECGDAIEHAMHQSLKQTIAAWLAAILNQRNDIFRLRVVKPSDRIANAIKKQWNSSGLQKEFKMEHPTIYVPNSLDSNMLASASRDIGCSTASDIAEDVLMTTMGTLFTFMVKLALNAVVAAIVAILTAAWRAVKAWLGWGRTSQQEIKDKLIEELSKTFRDKQESVVSDLSRDLACLRKAYVKTLRQTVDDHIHSCNENIEQTAAILDMDIEKRRKIAKECRHIREKHVVPVRTKLEEFTNQTIALAEQPNSQTASEPLAAAT
ncbi:MAG: hypothetical protein FWD61_02845 [Phycisphaerales bacterium]|nr:hypothetical protein [Phycisphaerales bacterium]